MPSDSFGRSTIIVSIIVSSLWLTCHVTSANKVARLRSSVAAGEARQAATGRGLKVGRTPGAHQRGHFYPAAVSLVCSFPIEQDMGEFPQLTLRFCRTRQGTRRPSRHLRKPIDE